MSKAKNWPAYSTWLEDMHINIRNEIKTLCDTMIEQQQIIAKKDKQIESLKNKLAKRNKIT